MALYVSAAVVSNRLALVGPHSTLPRLFFQHLAQISPSRFCQKSLFVVILSLFLIKRLKKTSGCGCHESLHVFFFGGILLLPIIFYTRNQHILRGTTRVDNGHPLA